MASSRPQPRSRQTRTAILDAALALASRQGIEGLSIGALADAAGMSKSGVFAHFGSREALQLSVVREYQDRFAAEVFAPALRETRGLPRLRTLFDRWLRRVSNEAESGCLYVGGAVEFDARPGPVRDALVTMVLGWRATLERAARLAVEAGHLRPDTDAAQLLFELQGLVLALHHDARFLGAGAAFGRARAGFERAVGSWLAPAAVDAAAPAGAR
jgi:AcrR family transcriptional regulator